MYLPWNELGIIDRNALPVLVLGGVAMVTNYALFAEALRVGRRNRTVTMPVSCTLLWLAHDGSYVARAGTWFHGYGHWFPESFWVALVVTTAGELALLGQLVAYGRSEFAPFLSPRQWVAAVTGAAVLVAGTWWALKHAMNDGLYLWSCGLTLLAYPACGLATMARRRSVAGFTPLQPAALTVMCLAWFAASVGWFGPEFRSAPWLLLAGLATAASALMTWVAVRHRRPTARAEHPAPVVERGVPVGV